jgi:hypothetical protein
MDPQPLSKFKWDPTDYYRIDPYQLSKAMPSFQYTMKLVRHIFSANIADNGYQIDSGNIMILIKDF